MTLAITINIILSAIVFAIVVGLISRSILSSDRISFAAPARAKLPRRSVSGRRPNAHSRLASEA
jgi:hypothetical protein